MRVPMEPSVVATIRKASAAYGRLDDVVHPAETRLCGKQRQAKEPEIRQEVGKNEK